MTLLVTVISHENAIMQQLIIRLMVRAANRYFSDSHWSETWIIVHTVNSACSKQGLKEAGKFPPTKFQLYSAVGPPPVQTTVRIARASIQTGFSPFSFPVFVCFTSFLTDLAHLLCSDWSTGINSSLTSFLTGLGPFAVP